MSSIRAMARLVRRRERDRDLAAARAAHAEGERLAAERRRVQVATEADALDDGLAGRLDADAGRTFARFPIEREAAFAAIATSASAAVAATHTATGARDHLGTSERALRTIERALDRARDRRRRAEDRQEQIAHDELASSRAWRSR